MSDSRPTLKEVDAAYLRGNFPVARRLAKAILKDKSLSEKDAAVARQILKAIDFDPIAAVGFGVTLFLLVFISIKFLM